MDSNRKNINLVKIFGKSASALGAAASVAALVPGVFLLEGATVGIVTTAFFVAGATGIGASVVENKLVKRDIATSEECFKNQEKATEDLMKLLDKYKEDTKIHLETVKMFDNVLMHFKKVHKDRVKVTIEIGGSFEEEIGYAKPVVKVKKSIKEKKNNVEKFESGGKVIIRSIGAAEGAKTAVKMADDAPAYCTEMIKNGIRTADELSGASVIVINAKTTVRHVSALVEHNCSLEWAAKSIREAANELETRALPELKDIINQTRLEAAEESGIPRVTTENETK